MNLNRIETPAFLIQEKKKGTMHVPFSVSALRIFLFSIKSVHLQLQ